MNKPTESLTESKKASNLALLSSTELCALRETLTQTEATEWVRRYKKKTMDLRQRMNALKEQND
jgi:hypothetical protein